MPEPKPLLLLLDVQRGLTHRPDRITANAIKLCGLLLSFARDRGWSIAHCYLQDGDALLGDYRPVQGFEPRTDEMVFLRSGLSAYSSLEFAELMDSGRFEVLISGLSASLTLLATLFDAQRLGHRFSVADGAIASSHARVAGLEDHARVSADVAELLGMRLVRSDGLAVAAPAAGRLP